MHMARKLNDFYHFISTVFPQRGRNILIFFLPLIIWSAWLRSPLLEKKRTCLKRIMNIKKLLFIEFRQKAMIPSVTDSQLGMTNVMMKISTFLFYILTWNKWRNWKSCLHTDEQSLMLVRFVFAVRFISQ